MVCAMSHQTETVSEQTARPDSEPVRQLVTVDDAHILASLRQQFTDQTGQFQLPTQEAVRLAVETLTGSCGTTRARRLRNKLDPQTGDIAPRPPKPASQSVHRRQTRPAPTPIGPDHKEPEQPTPTTSPNRVEDSPRTGRWNVRAIAAGLGVGGVAVVAGLVSYHHQRHLAGLHGQTDMLAAVWPLSVDGLVLATAVQIATDRARGLSPRIWSVIGFWLGVAVSIICNALAAAPDLISRAISAWPALAVFLAIEALTTRPNSLGSKGGNDEGSQRKEEAPVS